MKSFSSLPQGYEKFLSINLQKDKKIANTISVLALVIAAVLVVPMIFIVPFDGFANNLIIKIISLVLGIVAYTILHEFVHGIAMKLCGTKKIKYGFTGMYAFAGSDDFYDKKSYIFIALAPIIFWGVVLTVAAILVPVEWFWVVYIIQTFNLSGGAGDLYVTVKFAKLPKDLLVKDCGIGMTVYTKTN